MRSSNRPPVLPLIARLWAFRPDIVCFACGHYWELVGILALIMIENCLVGAFANMGVHKRRFFPHPPCFSTSSLLTLVLLLLLIGAGCSFGGNAPTRTPVPTWTPTPVGGAGDNNVPVVQTTPPPTAAEVAAPPTDTPAPPTPEPTATLLPTDTPTPEPTATLPPADTPTPEPTPTPAFLFELEAAEKFPTDSLAPNVVRLYLYVYSPAEFGLAGYSLQVLHNGSALAVDETSAAGVPEQTRTGPSPYTRFTNMSVIFVEPQAGRWDVQLIDADRVPVGPLVTFELTADEATRELYVRYRQQ